MLPGNTRRTAMPAKKNFFHEPLPTFPPAICCPHVNRLKIATLCLLLIAASAASAQGQLQVTVTHIRQAEGSLRVGLFKDKRDFLRQAAYGKVVSVTADSVTVSFAGVPPGVYGISVVHDRNGNGELDANLFGIPKEGFAFGNNAMSMFGPPSFEKASVKIGNSRIIQLLHLKHF